MQLNPSVASSQATYPSPRRKRQGSCAPLGLLFPTKVSTFVGALLYFPVQAESPLGQNKYGHPVGVAVLFGARGGT